ncbi:Mss4p nuclear export [Malassezia vespertilionis]|uniref:Bcp1p n=1 Tax=Malassezia vespertilionis TaxID=2020962 RepID=A0A2N1JDJ5_9BASI|nr:Mss4p nuclear export [Malassezia vespertilionis]PKI84613.1 Bcp1p [Malassezia vespertilionis]WFD06514.1 Mss4p nuclear export [Malassezia vespertilionis]
MSMDEEEEDRDFINVEFDFSAPCKTDHQALKRLFQQLFYTHAPQMDIGAMADYIIRLSQDNGIGTVVKVDDMEQVHDPYAVVSAMTIGVPGAEAAEQMRAYLVKQLLRGASGKALLELVQSASASSPLVMLLHERMINLPVQVVPPMLRMLYEEYEQGREEVTPVAPKPSHMLVFSRAFSADAFEEENAEATGLAGARKRKAEEATLGNKSMRKQLKQVSGRAPKRQADGLGSFHPEDEVMMECASHTYTFRFPPPPDAADTYEAPIFGRIFAIPYAQVPAVIKRVEEEWPVPS